MTETESLIAEVRQMRADVSRLHSAHTAVHKRGGGSQCARPGSAGPGSPPGWNATPRSPGRWRFGRDLRQRRLSERCHRRRHRPVVRSEAFTSYDCVCPRNHVRLAALAADTRSPTTRAGNTRPVASVAFTAESSSHAEPTPATSSTTCATSPHANPAPRPTVNISASGRTPTRWGLSRGAAGWSRTGNTVLA